MKWFITTKFGFKYIVITNKEQFIRLVKEGKIYTIRQIAFLLKEELLSNKPYTHKTFDIEIARLKTFVSLAKTIVFPCVLPCGEVKYCSPFNDEITELENFINLMERFKDETKKIRMKVRNLVMRWVINTLDEIYNTNLAYEITPPLEEFYYQNNYEEIIEWRKNRIKPIPLLILEKK